MKILILILTPFLSTMAYGQQYPPTEMLLTSELAHEMVVAANKEAKTQQHAVCITVVDRSGQTLAV